MSTTFTTRAPVQGMRGAIGTSSYLATEAGMNVLRQGGNCFDAIIAAAAVINVVEPHCSHLGGDAFLIAWDAENEKLQAINSSGKSPAGLRPEMFEGSVPTDGFLSSTIPGQVAGWDALHGALGTVPVAELLGEAIYYAEEGAPVSRDLAGAIAGSEKRLRQFPSSVEALMPDGRPPQRGEILRQPDLAATLKRMAKEGLREFYEGETARRIAEFWQVNGGVIGVEDLAKHRAKTLAPLETTYRGYTVYEQPPVSQGHILLQALNLVETFDLRAMGHLSAEAMHVCLEANKLAHADKNRYTTDPDSHELPMGLLSKEYAADRAMKVDVQRAMSFPPEAGTPPKDTTYMCCVDGKGNAVSYIQSVFHGFGCGVVAEGTGVVLNNRACGFSLDPEHVNFVQPNKKSVHTLNTYMVFRDGRPVIVGGTPGGDVQVQTNLQVLTNLIDFDRDPQQAAEDPRWTRGEKLNVGLEARAPRSTFEGLSKRGHDVNTIGHYSQGGRVQVIQISDNGALVTGSDPRCDGCALAF